METVLWSPARASTDAFWEIEVAFEVLWLCISVTAEMIFSGPAA